MKCMYVFLYTGNAYYDNSVLKFPNHVSLFAQKYFFHSYFFFNASVLNLLKIKFN